MRLVLSPDPVLRQKCELVDESEIKKLRSTAKNMAKLMYESNGCGIAAPQVGISKRLMVIDCTIVDPSDEEEEEKPVQNPTFYINPQIVAHSEEKIVDDEGCLSIPGITVPIKRYTAITVEALNLKGETFVVEAEDFHARAIQHELDHLDGKTMFEHLDTISRIEAFKAYDDALLRGAKPGDTSVGQADY